MTLRKSVIVLIGVAVLVCAALEAQIGALPTSDTRLNDASDPKFHVGDVWEYKTRAGEENATLTVVKIDSSPELAIIVHVAVDTLTWRDCRNQPFRQAVPHMPFARKVLEASLTKQVGEARTLPDYREGYDYWKTAYSNKKAGIYIIPVRDAVSVAERMYREGIGCQSDNSQIASRSSR
jgi:hypothetical protein